MYWGGIIYGKERVWGGNKTVTILFFLGLIFLGSVYFSSTVSAVSISNITVHKIQDVPAQNNQSHISTVKSNSHTVGTTNLAGNGNFLVGWLKIPRLGVDCKIRSDTVNAYNAAYHYPQSVAFGQPGECGLMSHRTTYSALFRHIDSLKVGDKVVVTNLARTKYIYQVTSNGKDIRWDYKTNPIKFAQSGSARLLLVSCYPLGYEKAAFITHCKLVAVDHIPQVVSTSPRNQATKTSRTATIAIKFTEKIKFTRYCANIHVKNLKTGKYVSISKIIRGNHLYIKTHKRSVDTWYEVILSRLAIQDQTSNYLGANKSFKFETGTN